MFNLGIVSGKSLSFLFTSQQHLSLIPGIAIEGWDSAYKTVVWQTEVETDFIAKGMMLSKSYLV